MERERVSIFAMLFGEVEDSGLVLVRFGPTLVPELVCFRGNSAEVVARADSVLESSSKPSDVD